MHTTESKWQDAPLELAEELEACAKSGIIPCGIDLFRSASTIRSLVQALEQKMRELDSLESSE